MDISISRDYSPGSSKSDLLNDYHRIAADTLLGTGCRTDSAILEAAEDGQLSRLKSLLANSPSSINARCPSSGDTPLIMAAREGHTDLVLFLLKHGADVTIQNDSDETALDVTSEKMKKLILGNIHHEDRAMSNAQALLHSAWLGDAVSVKKSLKSGKNYLDVNCRNSDGNSPLLLVTRDISVFERVQSAIQTDYDPVSVMQDLIANHADVNTCDKKGRSALHLVASSKSVHARKMVSLLLSSGSSVDSHDKETYSPLHMASSKGHKAIIVALVEEGGADVNLRGGETGATPLMLSAQGGHSEAAKYLISKGADVTAVDENGDTALNVAKSPSMVRLLKEAWVEQAQAGPSPSPSPSPPSLSPTHSSRSTPEHRGVDPSLLSPPAASPSILVTKPSVTSLTLDEIPSMGLDATPTTPQLEEEEKFFLTEGKIRRSSQEGRVRRSSDDRQSRKHSEEVMIRRSSEEREETDYPRPSDHQVPVASANEAEADDELEAGHGSRRVKPAARRAYIRGILSKRSAEREAREVQPSRATPTTTGADRSGSLAHLLNSEEEVVTYTSADEGSHRQPTRTPKLVRGRSRDDGKSVGWRKKNAGGSRPSNLALQRSNDPTLSRSYDCLATPNSPLANPRPDKVSPLLPNVGKSPMSPLSKTSLQYKPNSGPSQISEHLPSLANMQAVAVVAVDTDKEKLSMLNLRKMGRGVNKRNQDRLSMGVADGSSGFHRSKSLMNLKKEGKGVVTSQELGLPLQFNHKKRNSVGAVPFTRTTESKVPLLPSVVTSQFGFGIKGGGAPKPEGGAWSHTPADKSKGRGRFIGTKSSTPAAPLTKPVLVHKLSVVNEIGNSSQQSVGSKDSSTLKSSDFEVDSLEQEVVLFSTNSSTTTSPRHPQAKGEGPHLNGSVAEPRETGLLPPPPQNSNLMVSYANHHSATPLSPIWNQIGYFQGDSDSTNSEYITSYVGKLTPLPTVLSPDFNNKTLPPPMAGRQPDTSVPGSRDPSSGESGEEGEGNGCLKWKRGRLLGKGAYGKVWEGLLSSARMIAVKEVELDTDSLERAQSQYEKIQAEVGILRSLKHRNIVSYLGTSMHMAKVYIFMQYISGGSLQSIIKRFGPLDSHTVKHYTKQITSALCYIHKNDIVHRDIKGANIMVNSRGVVKLIDFGCAKNCADLASNMHSVRGTPYWMAPEVICGYGYGRKSDIWSLGCTVLEMATAKPPWADYPPEAAMFQIGMGKPIPPLPDHLPKILTDFFYLCLTREQGERPSAAELLQHKFLGGGGDTSSPCHSQKDN